MLVIIKYKKRKGTKIMGKGRNSGKVVQIRKGRIFIGRFLKAISVIAQVIISIASLWLSFGLITAPYPGKIFPLSLIKDWSDPGMAISVTSGFFAIIALGWLILIFEFVRLLTKSDKSYDEDDDPIINDTRVGWPQNLFEEPECS